jgi:hypothetical protein
VAGVDCIVHCTAHFPSQYGHSHPGDDLPWQINVKGLWNVLDCARQAEVSLLPRPAACQRPCDLTGVRTANPQPAVKRVVHIGSCSTVWPGSTDHPEAGSVFFDGSVRRPDASLYSATKRLQEELCRQVQLLHTLPPSSLPLFSPVAWALPAPYASPPPVCYKGLWIPQFYDASGLRICVLRPDGIMDMRHRLVVRHGHTRPLTLVT